MTFRRCLEEQEAHLSRGERWHAWERVLRSAFEASERDLDTAAAALDALEGLADEPAFAERMLDLLGDPSRWDPAWSIDDVDSARFRLLEGLSRLPEARVVLAALANRKISDGDPLALDLIDRIRALGGGEGELDPLRLRWEAERGGEEAEDAEAPAPGRPLTILIVGGNETQEAYEARLRQRFAETHPSATLEFEFSGWSANWGKVADRIRGRIGSTDAVVLLQFVRTQLGREVRRLAGEHDVPWVACTGHGRKWLERSIARAIAVAARATA